MSKEIKSIVVSPIRVPITITSEVDSFIAQAIKSGASIETLKELFELQKRVKAERAKAGFVEAMSLFQSKAPIIEKDKKVLNKDGRSVRYTYAAIDSIVKQIQKPLAESGLSYRWETKQEGKDITAICIVTHVLGHSERSEFTVSVDTEGFMTAPQKSASALTFAKRYSLCNALGISTGDEDTDATDVGKEKDVKSFKSKVVLRLRALGEKTGTKEDVEEAVRRLTNLALEDKNLEEIATRLEVVIGERQISDAVINRD